MSSSKQTIMGSGLIVKRSYYGHLVEDKRLGLRRLNFAKFSHVRRSANAAAHELATLARTHVTDVI